MKPVYNCAQQDLYMACRYGWWQCRKHLAVFAARKPKYTENFITDNLTAVAMAEVLPDFDARYTRYDLAKLNLQNCNADVILHYKLLMSYINDAFEVQQVPIMYKSSGKLFFEKTKRDIWPSSVALMSAAIPFIEQYQTTLEATVADPSVKNNMPPTFLADFKAVQTRFNGLLEELKLAEVNAMSKTTDKIEANNTIYAELMSMVTDAQLILCNDPILREEFTFANFLSKIRGTKQAGIGGFVKDMASQKPIPNAVITIEGFDKQSVTSDKGRYEIFPVMAGTYNATISAANYETIIIQNIDVKTGIMTRVNVELTPVLVPIVV